MDPSYKKLQTHIIPVMYDTWVHTLNMPISERTYSRCSQESIYINQVIARFLGVPADEQEYYDDLFDYVHELQPGLRLLCKETLNEQTFPEYLVQSIQKALNLSKEQNLSINQLVTCLFKKGLLIESNISALDNLIREALASMLSRFAKQEVNGLKSDQLERIITDVVNWSFQYLNPELSNVRPEKFMPKFMWYGDYEKSHFYFLLYLVEIGCDIIVFSPSGKDILAEWDPYEELTFVYKYPMRTKPRPFPVQKSNRKSTSAYRASREIEAMLNYEGSGLYKSWQLRDYIPTSVTLKTTYEELFILIKEKAMIRPEFEVKDGLVKIPVICSKLKGISKNRKEYWRRLHSLSQLNNSLLLKEFPFSHSVNNDLRFHFREAIGKDGLLSPEKMINSRYWKYKHLPTGLQKGIANALKNICINPTLIPMYKESTDDLRVFLFTQGLQIPSNILKLLQQFDYSQSVPKIILFNNGLNGILTRADAAILLLLNQFGIDIVIYNPSGHNDIENFIDESLYDIHWLEDVVFEQEFKEPSFLKKLFQQGFMNK